MATNEPSSARRGFPDPAGWPTEGLQVAAPPATPGPRPELADRERIYFPELDGLRFIAFLMVFLFHGGLPESMVWRHPFPGPGLAVRCLGPITAERLRVLRQADAIFLDELQKAGWYRRTAQAFAVLLPIQSVGVMGDGRTYEDVIALRAVQTDDFMTADWSRLPHEVLARASTRIINTVKGVNRVVYDVTSKPPGTIEWE